VLLRGIPPAQLGGTVISIEAQPLVEDSPFPLERYHIQRRGEITEVTPVSNSRDEHRKLLRELQDSSTGYFETMSMLVQQQSIAPLIRVQFPEIARFDFHFFTENFCMLTSRISDGSFMEHTQQFEGWCVLRLLLRGSYLAKVNDEPLERGEAEGFFLQQNSETKFTIEHTHQPTITAILILFKPEQTLASLNANFQAPPDELLASGQTADTGEHLLGFSVTPEVGEVCRKILNLGADSPHYLMLAQSRAQELLALSFLALTAPPKSDSSGVRLRERDIARLNDIKKLIETRYSQHHTLQQLAQQTGLNRRKLTEGFKTLFGTGVNEYLIAQRMKQAAILLHQGLNVGTVAEQVGYIGQGSFSRAFKRYYSVSPKQFQQT